MLPNLPNLRLKLTPIPARFPAEGENGGRIKYGLSAVLAGCWKRTPCMELHRKIFLTGRRAVVQNAPISGYCIEHTTSIVDVAREACGMPRQQLHMRSALFFVYRPGLAEVQQAAGGAAWPKTRVRKSRDGPVNCTVEAWHKQDDLRSCFYNPISFSTRLSHQFLMLHSDNVPLADTVFFTIAEVLFSSQ
jgi:hypothetical protein